MPAKLMTHTEAVEVARSGEGAIVATLLQLSRHLEQDAEHIERLQASLERLADQISTIEGQVGGPGTPQAPAAPVDWEREQEAAELAHGLQTGLGDCPNCLRPRTYCGCDFATIGRNQGEEQDATGATI